MKEVIPNYKALSTKEVFNSFTKPNRDLIDKFMNYCQITSSHPPTLRKIKTKIIIFTDLIEKDLKKITLEDLRFFLKILKASSNSREYKIDILKQVKRFLIWSYEDYPKRFNRFEDFKLFQKTNKKVDKLRSEDLFTPDEINFIIKNIHSLKYKTLIILLFESGGRPEEILKLKFKDVNFDKKTIHVFSNKTSKSRTIPLNESMGHLKRFKEEGFLSVNKEDYIFQNPQNKEKHISVQALNDYFAKIQDKLNLGKRFYPYILRHSRLNYLRKKLSPDTYEAVSGHSLVVASKFYKHLDNDAVLEEMNDKIYEAKTLTLQEKEELEELKESMKDLKKRLTVQTGISMLTLDFFQKKITKEQLLKGMSEIKKLTKKEEK